MKIIVLITINLVLHFSGLFQIPAIISHYTPLDAAVQAIDSFVKKQTYALSYKESGGLSTYTYQVIAYHYKRLTIASTGN